eukprot:6179504-Pleurochrysis_carterae.AAC.1
MAICGCGMYMVEINSRENVDLQGVSFEASASHGCFDYAIEAAHGLHLILARQIALALTWLPTLESHCPLKLAVALTLACAAAVALHSRIFRLRARSILSAFAAEAGMDAAGAAPMSLGSIPASNSEL